MTLCGIKIYSKATVAKAAGIREGRGKQIDRAEGSTEHETHTHPSADHPREQMQFIGWCVLFHQKVLEKWAPIGEEERRPGRQGGAGGRGAGRGGRGGENVGSWGSPEQMSKEWCYPSGCVFWARSIPCQGPRAWVHGKLAKDPWEVGKTFHIWIKLRRAKPSSGPSTSSCKGWPVCVTTSSCSFLLLEVHSSPTETS